MLSHVTTLVVSSGEEAGSAGGSLIVVATK